MKIHDKTVITATIGFMAYVLLLSLSGPVISSLMTNKTLGSAGSVKAIGVGVYKNYNCTEVLTALDWGIIEPGSTKNISCYIKNEGNYVVTLSMYTSNWNPQNATQYITFSWNLEGQTLKPGQVVKATFTLTVSSSIQGITNFSFDVTIVGSG